MGNNLSNINGNIWINNQIVFAKDDIYYILNYKEKTAKLSYSLSDKEEISIPRSIIFDSDEYIITSIESNAFEDSENSSISYPPDSEIRTIEKKAFDKSPFNYISIPPHVTTICEKTFKLCDGLISISYMSNNELQTIERDAFKDSNIKELDILPSVLKLKDGWCSGLYKLEKVKVSPQNKKYSYLDDKYIIEKSDINNQDYEILCFARRDLNQAQIPSFITRISSEAFAETLITSIVIPSSVIEIGNRVFELCDKLKKVEFLKDSKIQKIGKKAFYESAQIVIIPSSVVDLKDGWCAGMKGKINVIQNNKQNILLIDDKMIVQKSNLNSDDFDVLVYACNDIEEIIIPSFIKKIQPYVFNSSLITSIVIPSKVSEIGKHAFQRCENLQDIQFAPNSELQIIGKKSFANLNIKIIQIPESVTKICEKAFADCRELKKIIIPNSSKLKIIEYGAFMNSKIKIIKIPSNIVELANGWCCGMRKLRDIKIITNEEKNISLYDNKFIIGKSDLSSNEYDVLVFVKRSKCREIIVPSFIKIISSFSFSSSSFVESIIIPSQVTQIKKSAFYLCNKIDRLLIPNDSNLSIIEKDILYFGPIRSLYIPRHVKDLELGFFKQIRIIEFAEDVKFNDNINFDLRFFNSSLIIMIPAT